MTFASLIMPAFNVQATMRDTLAALLAQTYPDFEIIIVDDGSTDCTPGIAGRPTAAWPVPATAALPPHAAT